MNEITSNIIKPISVAISKRKEKGKWIIRVRGVTSGFIVHTEVDDSTIEFAFDASRFDPIIRIV